MSEQLYAVVFKKRIEVKTKTGKIRDKWERGFRAPAPKMTIGEMSRHVWPTSFVTGKLAILSQANDFRRTPMTIGLFSMVCRCGEICSPLASFSVMAPALRFSTSSKRSVARAPAERTHIRRVRILAISIDKILNYNSRMSVWMPTREVVANTFNRHDFAFCSSHCEIAPLVVGLGYDWAIEQTAKCIKELVELD